jgi:hypothetical protein
MKTQILGIMVHKFQPLICAQDQYFEGRYVSNIIFVTLGLKFNDTF